MHQVGWSELSLRGLEEISLIDIAKRAAWELSGEAQSNRRRRRKLILIEAIALGITVYQWRAVSRGRPVKTFLLPRQRVGALVPLFYRRVFTLVLHPLQIFI